MNLLTCRRNVILGLCFLGVIAMVCACVPEFENPLPVPEDLKADPKIVGYWLHQGDEEEPAMLHIYPRENGYIDLLLVTREKTRDDTKNIEDQGVLYYLPYYGFATTINSQPVLCVKPRAKAIPDMDESESKWFILPYYIDKNAILKIYLLQPESFIEAVESKALEGEADHDEAYIKSSSKQLADFFANKNIRDFEGKEPYMILKKFADIPEPFMPKVGATDSDATTKTAAQPGSDSQNKK